MEALKDSTNTLARAPLLEFSAKSPPKLIHSSPTRRSPAKDDPMNKPPTRISPFKDSRSAMSAEQIFATSPRRLADSRAHSVDRRPPTHRLPTVASSSSEASTTAAKPISNITFDKLKPMASSNMRMITPSRMVSSRQRIALATQSEQPISRLSRANAQAASTSKDPASNLMDSFTQKSILKRNLSPPAENGNDSSLLESEMDMTTTLNTLKNAESAKNVMKFLKAEATQPRKKRAVTFDNDNPMNTLDSTGIQQNGNIENMLKQVLSNQKTIMERLSTLEAKFDRATQ